MVYGINDGELSGSSRRERFFVSSAAGNHKYKSPIPRWLSIAIF